MGGKLHEELDKRRGVTLMVFDAPPLREKSSGQSRKVDVPHEALLGENYGSLAAFVIEGGTRSSPLWGAVAAARLPLSSLDPSADDVLSLPEGEEGRMELFRKFHPSSAEMRRDIRSIIRNGFRSSPGFSLL